MTSFFTFNYFLMILFNESINHLKYSTHLFAKLILRHVKANDK